MPVTFVSRSARFALHKGTKEVRVGPNKTVAQIDKIQFEGGRYVTDNEEDIKLLMESDEFKRRLIVRLDENKTKEQMAAIHGKKNPDPNAKKGQDPVFTP